MDPPHADYPPDSPPKVATGPYLTYHDDFGNGLGAPDNAGAAGSLQAVLMVLGAVVVFVAVCWRWSTVQRASLACCRICCDEEGLDGPGDGGPILPFYSDRVHEKRDRRREEMSYAKQHE